MFKVLGIVLLIMAIIMVVVPMFTDCQSQGKVITLQNGKQVSMKCHWAGVAEIGVAAPLAFVGVMMALGRRRENLTNLSILGIVLGVVAILFPTVLVGVCQTPTMTCVTAMKPTLISAGGVTIAASIAALVLSRMRKSLA